MAIADLTDARLSPTNAGAFQKRGHAWFSKMEYDKAIADFAEAVRLDPTNASAYFDRGKAWLAKMEHDKAIADFNEAIQLDPRSSIFYANRGFAWIFKNEYDKAITDYTERIRLDPQDAGAFLNRGDAWWSKKEYDKAIADCNESVRLEPKSSAGFNNLAWFLATCPDQTYRDGTKAVESGAKACELTDCKVACYLASLAAGYAELGDFVSAVKWQTKAIELAADPKGKEEHRSRLKLFQEKKPYRDTKP
jgi:tetratricopeptide (TPR) repeat protein